MSLTLIPCAELHCMVELRTVIIITVYEERSGVVFGCVRRPRNGGKKAKARDSELVLVVLVFALKR